MHNVLDWSLFDSIVAALPEEHREGAAECSRDADPEQAVERLLAEHGHLLQTPAPATPAQAPAKVGDLLAEVMPQTEATADVAPLAATPADTSDNRGNRRRKGQKMHDALQTAPPTQSGRPIQHFPLLTAAIGGLRGITVIGGPTKHGKSRLAANIVASVGGPDLPVLYLDMENDDQVDEHGEPMTVTVGHWISEAYGRDCPALGTMWGYHSFDSLKHDVPTFDGPVLIVLDTVQSIVGQSGDRMRTDLVALVEWAKEQVRRGHMVLLVSQVNDAGEFKESKSLKEGGWTTLTVKKTGDVVEVRVGNVRHQAISAKGVVLRMTGPRLTEVRALGLAARDESGAAVTLTPMQRAIVKHGDAGRIEFATLMRARGYSLTRNSASEKKGRREIAAAVERCEIGHPERGVYTYPAAPIREDKTEDIVSSPDVLMSSDANPQEHKSDQP